MQGGTSTIGPRGLPSLTGLRGVAAGWVLLYHVYGSNNQIPVLRDGWLGVDVFFALSGFILMYVHQYEFRVVDRSNVAAFFVVRFFRVYPLTAAVIALVGLMIVIDPAWADWYRGMRPGNLSLQALVRSLLIATRWWPPYSGDWNEPIWSVSVEIAGYAMFPLVAWSLMRSSSRSVALLIAVAVFGAFTAMSCHFGKWDSNDVYVWAFARMAGEFIGGAALGRAFVLFPLRERRWPALLSIVAMVVIIAGCLVPYGKLVVPAACGCLIFSLAFAQGPVDWVMSTRVALFFGRISFPLYLIHFMPMMWVWYYYAKHNSPYSELQAILGLLCVLCVAAAYLLHRFIEQPAHQFGRTLSALIKSSPPVLAPAR